MHKFMKPCTGDVCEWFEKSGIANQIIRYWIHGVNGEEGDLCFYGKIRHLISMPDGNVILGISDWDDDYDEDMYPSINYYPWSEISIVWFEDDQNDEDGGEWQNHREIKLMS